MAAVLSFLIYLVFRYFRRKSGVTRKSCICVSESESITTPTGDALVAVNTGIQTVVCKKGCSNLYEGKVLGITAQSVLDSLHYLSAGVVSFARGLNDTPKIVGLLVIINAMNIEWGMIAVAVTMAIGGLLNAKKVGYTISKKITPMNSGQGFTANMVTGLLVTTASLHGLPVSTTHVSVGSIFGIGTVTKKANRKMVWKILLSWLLTLPVAAATSGVLFMILENLNL